MFSKLNINTLRKYYPRLSGGCKLFGGDFFNDVLLDIHKINYDILSVQLYGGSDNFLYKYGEFLNTKLISHDLLANREDGGKYNDSYVEARKNRFPHLYKTYQTFIEKDSDDSITCLITKRNIDKAYDRIRAILSSLHNKIMFEDCKNIALSPLDISKVSTREDGIGISTFNEEYLIKIGDSITINSNHIKVKKNCGGVNSDKRLQCDDSQRTYQCFPPAQ